MSLHDVDVAIVGGGPAGTTVGSLLRKYNPKLRVAIVERERFPRDHVGESQLPPISEILDEMGVWDAVEAAGFPIKVGATYRWGRTQELWDFNFLRQGDFRDQPRPAKYQGFRQSTAFQVDRAIYDKILLDHARKMGCEVFEETRVLKVLTDSKGGDTVAGLVLENGQTLTARHYVDASGHAGIIRRAMGVEVEQPTKLQNIAVWGYWQNAEWAETVGKGATRVQVMSLGYGWIWFIPLGPTRTSIGLVLPAEYYKASGLKPEELLHRALSEEPRISELIRNAQFEGEVSTTKDWSFLARRMVGPNWYLVGESAGFADPILAAGMTLAHSGARELAYTILEIERGARDADWLKEFFERQQTARIWQHIRFADFWYSSNGQFTDLQEYCSEIARDAGMELNAEEAFRWLGTGGFIHDGADTASIATFQLTGVRQLTGLLLEGSNKWEMSRYNVFELDLEGTEREESCTYANGEIKRERCYVRGGKRLPFAGDYKMMVRVLKKHKALGDVLRGIEEYQRLFKPYAAMETTAGRALQALEVMVLEGWVKASNDPSAPTLDIKVPTLEQRLQERQDRMQATASKK